MSDGDDAAVTLKKGGTGPFQGALMSRKQQLSGIRNARFREYLSKYFPRDNVIMRPMEHIIEGITEGTCQRADGEQAHQTMDVQKPPSPTHLSIKEKYMQSASLSLLSNGQGEDTDRAEVGVMARIPIGGRKLLLKKEYAKKRKKEIELMQLEQALGRIETGAGEEVGEVNPNRYERLPPPTPQHRVITVRQKGRTNFANKNCEYYRQVMENFSKRRKRKREQRRETLIGLANLYSSLSEEMCSVVSENPTPNYALASLRQHQQDPRYRSSSAAVADRSILQATPIGRLPRARSEQAVVEEAAAASSKMLSQAEIEDYFVLLQGQRPNVPLANTDPRSLICSRQSSCSQLLGVNLQNMDRVSSLPPSSPPQPPINSAVMKAGDGENAGVDGVAEGTFQCPPGMENLWKALSDDLAHAQACLVCALLPDLVEANRLGYLMPANPFAPVQRLRSIQAVALNQDFVKHFQRPNSRRDRYSSPIGAPLSFFILPHWEQRYLGLRPDRDRSKLVIACRRPPEDVRLWLPNGTFDGHCNLPNSVEGNS
uniref:Uncharacterized protein n=1 Tax=Schistocephalus solidus TaxID=70667 RepID=A0A0V0J9C8_SCHSO